MTSDAKLADRYDAAAGLWPDKMRFLGYHDAYLGFLSHVHGSGTATVRSVIDIGAGTGAMAEAWCIVQGVPTELTLLDPSLKMLERGTEAVRRRGAEPQLAAHGLGEAAVAAHEVALAAHVIEHFSDPKWALDQIAASLRPGGQLWLVVSKPHWCNAIIWFQWRHRTFGDPTMRAMLDAAGFDLTATYAFPSGPPSRTSRGYVATRRGNGNAKRAALGAAR